MPGMNGVQVSELVRRIEQLMRYGTIAAVDHTTARCRVRTGALLSTWVPWVAQRAGNTQHWSPPTVGEQCLLLSPGGDTAGAVAVLGLYSSAVPAPSSSANNHVWQHPDGAVISYDHATHALHAALPGGSSATLDATTVTINATTVTVNAPTVEVNATDVTVNASELTINSHVQLNGSMDATGDVTASGISLVSHVHGGVTPGPGTTGQPQ
jgi:phage baseplate assembly protein V